ncbi:hypothetical protein THRCLA_01566 [Thraustotheca clavata]|uniref:Uncharacterized protein n=1 Tax=Thraustotheca clavata TaxID=74557 RepID=A0A1W0A8Q2_9STRA|nr:hypothetical protein THRCLA_01566 [Thraustotheca clavata]
MQCLKQRIYDLEMHLYKVKRVRVTLLPWEDVAKALADDTLDKVRENRSIKRELAHKRKLARLLQQWIQSLSPEMRYPNVHVDSWRNSHIFHGDEASRRVGYEWLIKQLYHNTERELMPLGFPASNDYFLDTSITFKDTTISLQQQMQMALPYSLEIVSRAIWIAVRTFIHYIQRKPHSLTKLLEINDDIEYVQEDMGPKTRRIDSKLLYGRFQEPDRTVVVTRAVRSDDAYPIESTTWTTDMKQWFVLERIDANSTRCRFYDILGHPSTQNGYVSIQDIVRQYRYEPLDDAHAMQYCRQIFPSHQRNERAMFARHLDCKSNRRRKMVAELHKIRKIKRDELKPCFENPPAVLNVKCKRLKEMQLLRRHIYELEEQLGRLEHKRTTLLPWKEVCQALAEETLVNVRDNRNLKSQLFRAQRYCAFLRKWLSPIPRSPNASIESWQHSQLIAGDAKSRKMAYEWIARQAYHNTQRAMAHLSFPDTITIDGIGLISVNVEFVDDLIEINVMTQQVLPYTLDEVSASLWVADKTFVQYAQGRTDFRQELQVVSEDMEYVQEELTPGSRRIFDNVLYGRFYEDNRTVIVMRSILKDELFPLEKHMWTIDTKQWMVADRLSKDTTRCRTYYSIKHPSTDIGYVSLQELAECFCHSPKDDTQAKQMLRDRFLIVQRLEREQFAAHLDNVLLFQALGDAICYKADARSTKDNLPMVAEVPLTPPPLVLAPVKAVAHRPDRPLKVSTSTTVKCKRVQELQYLHRHIEELEETLRRCQRPYTPMMLPWKEVSAGLAHDTLVHIRENRCLKKEVENKKKMIEYLKAWLQGQEITRRSPSPFVETWRNCELLAGDETFRTQAYSWIMQQCFYNTDRAMSTMAYPDKAQNNDFIDVHVVPDDNDHLEIHVTTQRVLDFGLPIASEAAWVADKTFYEFYREETTYREELDIVNDDMEYIKEDIGPIQKVIVDNALYCRYREENRTVIVLRSILNDEAHPLDADTWTVDIKQWMVLDAIDADKTRLRTYYIMKHPTTKNGGYVSLEEFAECFQLHAPRDDKESLKRKLSNQFQEKQRIERQKFATHMDSVLERLETLEMLDAVKGEELNQL